MNTVWITVGKITLLIRKIGEKAYYGRLREMVESMAGVRF